MLFRLRPDSKKNKGLSPRTAIAFELHTTNGSFVIPKTVGIESIAKIMSVVASAKITKRKGVAAFVPFGRRLKKLCPWNSSVTGIKRLNTRTIGFCPGSTSESPRKAIL